MNTIPTIYTIIEWARATPGDPWQAISRAQDWAYEAFMHAETSQASHRWLDVAATCRGANAILLTSARYTLDRETS